MTDTAPLTDQQLADIRQRVNAASPGPWSADGHEIYQGTPDDYTINSPWIGETCNIDLPDHGDANGAFLAHARQDVPALLAEVDRLRAELATARADGMREGAATLRRHCPIHGYLDHVGMTCHCEAADQINAAAPAPSA